VIAESNQKRNFLVKRISSEYNLFFKGLMEPTCLNIIFIRVCVSNTCGFQKKSSGVKNLSKYMNE